MNTIVKANFDVHEMIETDIDRAISYFTVTEPQKHIKKVRPLLKTVLHDFGLENINIYIRRKTSTGDVIVNLEKITKDDLEPGNYVNYKGYRFKVLKVYGPKKNLLKLAGNSHNNVLAEKKEVTLC